tara:strand:+ start:68758 stop:69972 length:1215 start_codon:yes stop_codon:yes gene_type:complete
MSFDVNTLRQDFPILDQQVNGKPLVYLDNAATTQKPRAVIEAVDDYYRRFNSNVHRAAHHLSDIATRTFEDTRAEVAAFINASREEVIWTKGTTEGINLVAQCVGRERLKPGDEVLITTLEHHANIVPWQQACLATGATLKVVPLREDGSVDEDAYYQLLNERTRIVALSHVSNSLGTVNPVAKWVQSARQAGAITLVDGAQAVGHFPVDVARIGCDFYAFSAHKMFGPTGIGALFGRRDLLEAMPPYQTGGEMIEVVTFERTTWNQLPYKFEPGTPNIAGVVGFGAAVRWLNQQDRTALASHEDALIAAATEHARAFKGLKIIGNAATKIGILSFLLDGAHPGDVGMLLDQQGVAVRTGHHCCMPLMDSLGIPGTARASFSIYNTLEEVDGLFRALEKVRTFL